MATARRFMRERELVVLHPLLGQGKLPAACLPAMCLQPSYHAAAAAQHPARLPCTACLPWAGVGRRGLASPRSMPWRSLHPWACCCAGLHLAAGDLSSGCPRTMQPVLHTLA